MHKICLVVVWAALMLSNARIRNSIILFKANMRQKDLSYDICLSTTFLTIQRQDGKQMTNANDNAQNMFCGGLSGSNA